MKGFEDFLEDTDEYGFMELREIMTPKLYSWLIQKVDAYSEYRALSCIEASLIKAAENARIEHYYFDGEDGGRKVLCDNPKRMFNPDYHVSADKSSINNSDNIVIL